MENSKGKIKGNDLYLKMLLLFPIFTLFQSFSGLGWLNRILFMLTVLVQMVLQFKGELAAEAFRYARISYRYVCHGR